MLSLSAALFRSHTKRLTVVLKSAAMTGYHYYTDKSPNKSKYKMALRKFDPIANKHVMFYESALPASKRGQRIMIPRAQKYARLTGKNMKPLIQRVEKAWERGFFPKYNQRDLPSIRQ
ncbi:putative 50S ribosomal protein L33 [Cardiosporidium cionae]|uniref:50S ribosomal protein L33 n=1 Tax=Cardiosporidium cionae TaxID=476202 RepID=A0ABQ7J681_9APIC|nr:putative 50S ribosomal protein L33 [Cardiosporidium cionae]|eukprot:KAF8819488.1 putative 50S ribosomal protein L33 [Cardiosporidium cionae]